MKLKLHFSLEQEGQCLKNLPAQAQDSEPSRNSPAAQARRRREGLFTGVSCLPPPLCPHARPGLKGPFQRHRRVLRTSPLSNLIMSIWYLSPKQKGMCPGAGGPGHIPPVTLQQRAGAGCSRAGDKPSDSSACPTSKGQCVSSICNLGLFLSFKSQADRGYRLMG